ncbi:hypothetical protein THAOC_31963 [Thalassiosira oceanica]|uniref:Uncharacterized protein n=1 Tax=Thalassiosira oceanica TaxID=159749 RepID=K0RAD7_THAOC|nr:hypothetical protein THAOC_31963 [Thalassiosira oceanica]|eukprot:EJK49189.1 hypothetical protein THAOC_31963 [Thalassiosira oceanica]
MEENKQDQTLASQRSREEGSEKTDKGLFFPPAKRASQSTAEATYHEEKETQDLLTQYTKTSDFECAKAARPAGSLRFPLNNGVLRWEMRWPLVFMVFSHCLWVWKGRADMIDSESEPILTRGPGNLVSFFVWGKNRTFARTNGRGPSTRQGAQLDEAGQHSSPLFWPGPVSIIAKCAPEEVPSGHEEGEARQLKTNPFPTQSYPTRKRQVQPISSNKPRDGRAGEKFVTSNAAEES